MKYEIRHWYTGEVIFEAEAESFKECVELAIEEGVSLRYANFRDKCLYRARLRDTDFTGADFTGADMRDSDLRKTSLFGSCLRGANLFGVLIDHQTLIWAADR